VRSHPGPVIDNRTAALARAWHVVATSEEIGSDPVQVWLLGEPWCLAHLPGGTIGAWADRCPHRLALLSAGRLVGDELQCGYHGKRFGEDGRCRAIPATGDRPSGRWPGFRGGSTIVTAWCGWHRRSR